MDKNTACKILRESDCICNGVGNFKIVSPIEIELIADFIEQQEKYAELGRLALTTRANVCSNNDFIKRGAKQCEKHCTNYPYCAKRAELLAKGVY